MSTMNDYYFHRIRKRQKHNTALTTLIIIQKLLIVISVYLVFGLLFQHVYASIKTDIDNEISNPYQTRHGSVLSMETILRRCSCTPMLITR